MFISNKKQRLLLDIWISTRVFLGRRRMQRKHLHHGVCFRHVKLDYLDLDDVVAYVQAHVEASQATFLRPVRRVNLKAL